MANQQLGRGASRSRRAGTVAGLVLAGLSVACASGGGSSSGADVDGRRTATVGIGTTSGSLGVLDLTVDASVARSSVVESPLRVWSVMPAVLEALGVEVQLLDSRQLTIGNTQFEPTRLDGRRLSRFLNCGNSLGGQNADRYRVTMYLTVQLEEAEGGGTLVTTVMDAYARPRSVSGNSVHCTSRGTLEERVPELIAEHLSDD